MIAIVHGKLQTVTQGVVEDGTLLINNGKITAMGTDIPVPEGAEILDAAGKWVKMCIRDRSRPASISAGADVQRR